MGAPEEGGGGFRSDVEVEAEGGKVDEGRRRRKKRATKNEKEKKSSSLSLGIGRTLLSLCGPRRRAQDRGGGLCRRGEPGRAACDEEEEEQGEGEHRGDALHHRVCFLFLFFGSRKRLSCEVERL